ncbi:hypothetical protein FQA39_LY17862 [Lamprigera yunnana]|nr:hypothetical protein FQA39_LY17862 [Lamprigera yunnana]
MEKGTPSLLGQGNRSSVVSTKSSTITITKLSSRNNKFEYVRDYLNRYGYFNGQDSLILTIEDVNSSEFVFALNKFQADYKLEITKTKNDETLEYKDHLKERDSKRCGFTLDNNELAHTFFPCVYSVSEIHINQNKDWNEELYDILKDKLQLFIALAHEIGHAIGIDHSPIHQSLMHSVYQEPTSPFNAEDFELSEDDQLAVANLYGQRKIKKKSKTTTTTTTKRTIPPPHLSPPAK